MSHISPEEVKKIAGLARLGLGQAELEQSAVDVTNVLDHFARLQAIQTATLPAGANMSGRINRTRLDVAEAEVLCSTSELLTRAGSSSDRLVKTPSVRS